MTNIDKQILYKVAFTLNFLNIVIFMIIENIIGGVADLGGHEAGKYFVREHDKIREVTHPIFLYSVTHFCFLLVTSALCLWTLKPSKSQISNSSLITSSTRTNK